MLQIYEKISGHNAFLRFWNSLLMHSQNDNTSVLPVFSFKKLVTIFILRVGYQLNMDIPFEVWYLKGCAQDGITYYFCAIGIHLQHPYDVNVWC